MGTISKEITLKSIALMTGVESEAKIYPSDKKGIRFHYNKEIIEGKIENVVSTEHCTVIGNSRAKIMLIEHFMASCAICGIDAIDIYLTHYEMPILDGGAKTWVNSLKNSGIVNPDKKKSFLKEAVYYLNGKTHLIVLPSNELNLTYSVNYNHKDLRNRWVSLNKGKMEEIIEARTFGYLNELERLQEMGYARGADIENTLGLKDNDEYTSDLKSEFEPIKHKILDLIGDFYLIGCNVLNFNAEIIVKEAGHTVHVNTAKVLKDKLIKEE